MKDRLNAVLAGLGEPRAVEVQPFARSRRYENMRVQLEDGSSRLLRLALDARSHRGLLHESAAWEIARSTDLPVVDRYTLLDPRAFGTPASLSQWLPGLAGQGVIDAHPDALPAMCTVLGQLRRVLEQQSTGPMAMSVVDGRFQAIRHTWADEYLARVWDWHAKAVSVGASLGPLLDTLMDRLDDATTALEQVDRFSLVHGDLRPVNLMLDLLPAEEKDAPPGVSLTGVFDWEFAVMGDPLLAFALPLELPDDALAFVLAGYGQDVVREWVDDEAALMRLSAYAIGRSIQFLALIVSSQMEAGGMPWGYGMAYAARICEERARPGFVREKLLRALPDEAPEDVVIPDLVDPVRAVIRRALGRLAGRPVLGVSVLGPWIGAIGAALRDRDHEAEGWVRDGEALLDALGPGVELRGFEPIEDRRLWLREFDARMRASDSPLVAGVWWLTVEAMVVVTNSVDPTEWSVSDDVLRGLESFLEIIRRQPASQAPTEVLLHALLGLAGAERIGVLLGNPDAGAIQRCTAQLNEAWEDLTVFGGLEPVEMDGPDFNGRRLTLSGWIVPVVLFATEVSKSLPVPRRQLIGALCGSLA